MLQTGTKYPLETSGREQGSTTHEERKSGQFLVQNTMQVNVQKVWGSNKWQKMQPRQQKTHMHIPWTCKNTALQTCMNLLGQQQCMRVPLGCEMDWKPSKAQRVTHIVMNNKPLTVQIARTSK